MAIPTGNKAEKILNCKKEQFKGPSKQGLSSPCSADKAKLMETFHSNSIKTTIANLSNNDDNNNNNNNDDNEVKKWNWA